MKTASPALKVCGYSECHKPLVPRKREGPSEFSKRKYCALDCSHADKRRLLPPKVCARAACLVVIEQGYRPPSEFAKQQYCSPDCGNKARIKGLLKGRPGGMPDLSGPHVQYDINNPPPCFMEKDFFAIEREIFDSVKNMGGAIRKARVERAMVMVEDRWCLNCPILSECEAWGVESKYTGIAGGVWLIDGEAT